MRDSFGARLRHRRERRHLALATISENTKIKLSLLEELERDDTTHWPVGIFRRAFIRAYAEAIGLDPDEVVREFLLLHPDPEPVDATAIDHPPGFAPAAPDAPSPPTRFRYLVGNVLRSLRGADADQPREAAEPEALGASAPEASLGSEPALLAAADLCTEFARLEDASQVTPLLGEAASLLDAIGAIVWVWDPVSAELKPSFAHGYSERVLAQLPKVGRDAGNATAAAFRSVRACTVPGTEHASGALAVPLISPSGCVGVLAVELPHRREQLEWVRALVTIIAAQLARLVAPDKATDALSRKRA